TGDEDQWAPLPGRRHPVRERSDATVVDRCAVDAIGMQAGIAADLELHAVIGAVVEQQHTRETASTSGERVAAAGASAIAPGFDLDVRAVDGNRHGRPATIGPVEQGPIRERTGSRAARGYLRLCRREPG